MSKFGNRFAQIYGMTEAVSGACLRSEDHFVEGKKARLLASSGKEDMCAQVRVVDESDRFLNPGEVGEIVQRGKHVMLGYWKKPDLTRETLRNGWLHTGDMGYMDEEGYLYLVDRKADMIITGGENVYPQETENTLYEHPAVRECAVVSAPDDKWGERVQAVVVLKEGIHVSEQDLIDHCKGSLAGYKCPKAIEFWKEIPKTPVGKLLRREVKKHFWRDKKSPVS
jgi:long-chain acyl-CoA synthetase